MVATLHRVSQFLGVSSHQAQWEYGMFSIISWVKRVEGLSGTGSPFIGVSLGMVSGSITLRALRSAMKSKLSAPSPAPTNCGDSLEDSRLWLAISVISSQAIKGLFCQHGQVWSQQQDSRLTDHDTTLNWLKTQMGLPALAYGWFETTSSDQSFDLAIVVVVGGCLNLPHSNHIWAGIRPHNARHRDPESPMWSPVLVVAQDVCSQCCPLDTLVGSCIGTNLGKHRGRIDPPNDWQCTNLSQSAILLGWE